jgi:hypothetical protein
MVTSIFQGTEFQPVERVPQSSPPWVWVGFVFAGAFFIIEILFVVLGVEEAALNGVLTLIMLGGWIYWLFCVHRIHKILAELTANSYPIAPGEAVGKHIIPFYNFYWIFKWPGEFSHYINSRGRVRVISGAVIGVMLLLSLLLRFFDGAIGMAFLFGVTAFVSSKLKAHVKAVKGITPDQLPPLPDPRIFSQPIETSASPAAETVNGPQVG